MVSRTAQAIVLLVGLAACEPLVGIGATDLSAICLEAHPNDVGCCLPGLHVDQGTCCPAGYHVLTDVEHPDWKVCVLDEDPPEAQPDAGADAQ